MISLKAIENEHRERERERSCARMLRLCVANQVLASTSRRARDPMEPPSSPLERRQRRIAIPGTHAALGGHGIPTFQFQAEAGKPLTGAQRLARDPHANQRHLGFSAEGRPGLRERLREGL